MTKGKAEYRETPALLSFLERGTFQIRWGPAGEESIRIRLPMQKDQHQERQFWRQ